jgi:hypothetical protein
MNELIFVLVFILWYVFALIVSEKFGKNSKPGTEWLFFIAMVFSPVTGFIIAKTKIFSKID